MHQTFAITCGVLGGIEMLVLSCLCFTDPKYLMLEVFYRLHTCGIEDQLLLDFVKVPFSLSKSGIGRASFSDASRSFGLA